MKFFFIANQLLKNPYPLWNVLLGKILERDETFILIENDSSQSSSNQIVDNLSSIYNISESSINIHSEKGEAKSGALFLTEALNDESYGEFESLKTIGFIGFNDKIDEKLDFYNSINAEIILSEIIANEIPHVISDSNFSYLTSKGYFVPPLTDFISINKSSNKRTLIIEDSKKFLSPLEGNLLKALKSINNFYSIDLNQYDGKEEIETEKIISFVENPQINHALILSSQVDVHFFDPKSKNPYRCLYIEDSYVPQEVSFITNNRSIRSNIQSIIDYSQNRTSSDKSNLINNPAQSIETEVKSLLNLIVNNERETLPYRSLSLPTLPKVKKQLNLEGLPSWILHFSTESFLHGLTNQLHDSKNNHIQELTKDALCLLHAVDIDCEYLTSFKQLFPKPDKDYLNRFSRVAGTIPNGNKKYFPNLQAARSQIASRFLRAELPNCFISKKSTFGTDDYSRLLDYIYPRGEPSPSSSSSDMFKLQILTMDRQFEEALNFCRTSEDLSSKNILHTTFAILTALFEEYDYCAKALNSYQETDKQYAKDNVLVAYVTARLFVNETLDEKNLEIIIKAYQKRKPSAAWWMSDLICMAIVKLFPHDESSEAITNCIEFLRKKCDFTDEDILALRKFVTPNDKKMKSLQRQFLTMLEGKEN
tara:strand:- start:4257 stop:6209 length:1953 start_codon:yes stop_codon:yes gene_type:complete